MRSGMPIAYCRKDLAVNAKAVVLRVQRMRTKLAQRNGTRM